LTDPGDALGVSQVRLVEADGSGLSDDAAALFMIYTPEVPADENRNGLQGILPEHDFFFAAVDGQTAADGSGSTQPGPLTATSPLLYDPFDLATVPPAPHDPVAGDLVLMAGYPTAPPFDGTATAAVGRVLDDRAAEAAIDMLAAVGDVEGDIPYAAEAELVVEGSAMGGMSGGGVFDQDGHLVGIIVRASDERDGTQYVRAVRLTYAANQLGSAIEVAGANLQRSLVPYLESPFESLR
jgi:hypothetical protein